MYWDKKKERRQKFNKRNKSKDKNKLKDKLKTKEDKDDLLISPKRLELAHYILYYCIVKSYSIPF